MAVGRWRLQRHTHRSPSNVIGVRGKARAEGRGGGGHPGSPPSGERTGRGREKKDRATANADTKRVPNGTQASQGQAATQKRPEKNRKPEGPRKQGKKKTDATGRDTHKHAHLISRMVFV